VAARNARGTGRALRRIGLLMAFPEHDPLAKARLAGFQQGLERLGWLEGRDVRIDARFAADSANQMQMLAKELVALNPDVIVAHTTAVAVALQRESRTIPIVFVNVSDPIDAGSVASLAQPGTNFTGFLLYEEGITGKWLAMLKEIAPRVVRAALLGNPKTAPYDYFVRSGQAAASALAIEVKTERL
jgi:putative ABC transport system substrate-binding protein